MPHSIDSIAAMIPPQVAQVTLARVIAALGSQFDWDSDTLAGVGEAVAGVAAYLPGVPPFMEQDEAAVAFWQGI